MATAATRDRGADRVAVAQAAAGLSFAAACLHGSVMVTHFREYFLFGLFFAIVTPLQIAWAGLVVRSPGNRRLLTVGALGNLSIATVWFISRTVGLPFGPERLQAEGIGVKDVLATWNEVLIAMLVLTLVSRAFPRPAPRWLVGVAWTFAAVGIVAALMAGNGH